MSFVIILIVVICSSVNIIDSSNPLSIEVRIKSAGYALNSLQRLLNFFENDVNSINVDGIFCLRVAQSQLNSLDQMISLSKTSEIHFTDQTNLIQSLSIQIDRIANSSLKMIAVRDSSYFQQFSFLLSQPFRIEFQSQILNQTLIENSDQKDSYFDTQLSDHCFGELLGSNNDSGSNKCLISEVCWKKMTSSMTKDYRLTHQLLWLLIAKNLDCINNQLLSNQLNGNAIYLQNYFCANIYEDAQWNFNNNFNQDLFLEQLLLCSIIGYEQFLRLDWFNTILTWQHPEYHCFSYASDTMSSHSVNKRHLLFERVMTNGCLSHKSGLAAGLLATYSRFFLQ